MFSVGLLVGKGPFQDWAMSGMPKVTPLIWFDKEQKDSNLWVHGSENMADAERLSIRALGVWL